MDAAHATTSASIRRIRWRTCCASSHERHPDVGRGSGRRQRSDCRRPLADADPLWYKDAIIYQLHVKAFRDSNADGYGDFRGLIEKLDYIERLGATAIWLLPFYPVAAQGRRLRHRRPTRRSTRRTARSRTSSAFLEAAHDRGIRVITELVINHTSDQHPWFQRARRAPKGSPERDWYVWSDDPNKYAGTRIIFTDTETSNWTWDPVAQQFFWHRFFSHQPDLNFDNPAVLEAVKNVMRFWLRMGVDGLRLDAIPYLIERDGTNCENLPETHDVLKELRAGARRGVLGPDLPRRSEPVADGRALRTSANGDECHMAFHFPRDAADVHGGSRKEDRTPIVDIMAADAERSRRIASGRSSCATTMSSRSRW